MFVKNGAKVPCLFGGLLEAKQILGLKKMCLEVFPSLLVWGFFLPLFAIIKEHTCFVDKVKSICKYLTSNVWLITIVRKFLRGFDLVNQQFKRTGRVPDLSKPFIVGKESLIVMQP